MAKYRHHTYKWTQPFGWPHHLWSLVGPLGGVAFTASFYEKSHEPSCGLEFHHTRAAGYAPNEAPHHTTCWLTGEPCWHDGTSLYASETIWPQIEPFLSRGDHAEIFRILEHEADRQFEKDRPDAN